MPTTYWPEHYSPREPHSPARRVNYTLRERIEEVMAFVRPPQKMPLDVARVALQEVGAPRPVIERLIGGLVECRQ